MTERFTIGETAERLGVSPDTVRRRLKREELQGERDAWREQAASERDASAQLRVLLQQAQTLAGAIPATVGQEGGRQPSSAHATGPAQPSFWNRLFGRSSR